MEAWMIERKSCRRYLDQRVPEAIFEAIETQKENFQFPHHQQFDWGVTLIKEGAQVSSHFTGPISRYVCVKAPHYLLLSCAPQENDSFLIGFLGQCFVRMFTELGIATCWVGFPIKDELAHSLGVPTRHHYKVMIAFGHSEAQVHKPAIDKPSGHKRKTLSQIGYNGQEEDQWLYEALNVAPSAVNTQPWYLEHKQGSYHYYVTKKSLLSHLISKMNAIDMGIGFYHIYSTIKSNGYRMSWEFEVENSNIGRQLLHFKYFE